MPPLWLFLTRLPQSPVTAPPAPYLRLLFLHPQDPRGDLDGGQGFRVAAGRGRDVRDHGGAAVHVPQGLAQQHGELAVPAGQSGGCFSGHTPRGPQASTGLSAVGSGFFPFFNGKLIIF